MVPAKQQSDSPESVVTRGLFKEASYQAASSATFDPSRSYELSSLIELGLANNPLTRSAWFNALATGAQVGQAKALYYPRLSL